MLKYKMTAAEYTALKKEFLEIQRKLNNAEIIDDYNPGQKGIPPRSSGMFGVLDETKLKRLFGANYAGVWCYNFDARTSNRTSYLGRDIWNKRYNKTNVTEFKRVVEAEFKNIEVAACAVMAVKMSDFPGFQNRIVKNPQFNRLGHGIVGTLVCRDKLSGEIFDVNSNWITVAGFESKDMMVQAAMSRFAVCGARDFYFRQRLMAKYK